MLLHNIFEVAALAGRFVYQGEVMIQFVIKRPMTVFTGNRHRIPTGYMGSHLTGQGLSNWCKRLECRRQVKMAVAACGFMYSCNRFGVMASCT